MKKIYLVIMVLFIAEPIISAPSMTNWKIEPSFKYDLCCFLNILTGDEFYREYYKDEFNPYADKMTQETRTAIDTLYKKLKKDNGIIISAWLSLYFSAIDGGEIDDMIAAINDPSELKSNFIKTTYYDDESWEIFVSVKSELLVILKYLEDHNFKNYWVDNIKPKIQKRIDNVKPSLDKYDVIKENEYFLGYKLPSDTITVYMLYYNKPHGIKITGMRFITSIEWPFEITVRTSAHEMMHPPYDYKNDAELRDVIDSFSKDDFLMDKVKNHNQSFGYNTLEGLFEEDCVQALDQLINEKLGVSKEAKLRWKESDDGIHVIAIALYQVMKRESYNRNNEVFRDFLIRIVKDGLLKPGMIKQYYDNFYN